MDDAAPKEEGQEAHDEDPDSSEVDSDAAEKFEGREYTGLLDRKKVAAAKPKPAAKKGQTQPAGKGAKPKVSTQVASKRSQSGAHEASAASSPPPTPPPNPSKLRIGDSFL